MVNILGTITNSTGTPLEGTLDVRLLNLTTTDTTAPDTIYTTVPQTFSISNGVVNIVVPATDLYEVPYQFTFTETGKTIPLFAINKILPDVATVQLASFFPTGITDRNLDVSALRVARLLGRDQSLSQLIKQPAVFSRTVTGQTTEVKAFLPKPFDGAVLVRSLTILGISGYELWDYAVGVLNSSGNEDILVPESVSTVTQNGRRRIQQTYEISRAASVMGLFILATPRSGANALNATLALSFTELN